MGSALSQWVDACVRIQLNDWRDDSGEVVQGEGTMVQHVVRTMTFHIKEEL